MAQTQSTLLSADCNSELSHLDIVDSADNNICRYCRKTFSTPQGLSSHIAGCPVRKSNYDIY